MCEIAQGETQLQGHEGLSVPWAGISSQGTIARPRDAILMVAVPSGPPAPMSAGQDGFVPVRSSPKYLLRLRSACPCCPVVL